MTKLVIQNWKNGLNKVCLTKFIREKGYSLEESITMTSNVLENNVVEVETNNVDEDIQTLYDIGIKEIKIR